MADFTITTVDGGFEINLTPTEIVLGIETISGYGVKGDKGDTGEQGPAGAGINQVDDVPGLTLALSNKAALIHTHVLNDITDFDGVVLSGGSF